MSWKTALARPLGDALGRISPALLTRVIIRHYANAAPARPRPWSMAHNFTSWQALTDLRYNGRHLARDPYFSERKARGARPNPSDDADLCRLEALFLRNGRPQQDCERSSVLFMFFAQWFTDAFLRTNFDDFRQTDSNHEVDFCALYGLTSDKTDMLRVQSIDATGNVLRAESGDLQVAPRTAHLLASERGKDGSYPPRLFDENGRVRDAFRQTVTFNEEDRQIQLTRLLHDPAHIKRITANQSNEDKKKYYAMGLEHGNGTLGYVVLNVLMLRAHNKIAEEILTAQRGEPGWTEDRVFHAARSVLTVILLKIVVEDYVAHIADFPLKTPIGIADRAPWGKPNRIALEFNLLYRWHSLVPDNLHVDGEILGPDKFRGNPGLAEEFGIAKLLTEFSKQPAGRIGLGNYPDFFGEGQALKRTLSINYEAQFKTMNAYRHHYGLATYSTFRELVGTGPGADKLASDLRDLYGDIGEVDWFVGMIAEKHAKRSIMGQLMKTMVANDAFTQALTNPLLSKRIYHDDEVFSKKGRKIMESISTLQELSDYVLGPNMARCSFSV